MGRDPRLGRHLLRLLSDEVLLSDNPDAVARRETRALAPALDAILASPLARVGESRHRRVIHHQDGRGRGCLGSGRTTRRAR